jgi:hypothetical protein
VTAAKPPTTGGIPLPPRVASIRATVKTAPVRGRFDIVTVGWLPTEGWFCTGCDADSRRRPCAHVGAVLAAITPQATP